MELVNESQNKFDELGILLRDMKDYLYNVEQGSQELLTMFHKANKSKPLEMLTQIMEGLSYYQKLLKTAAVLLMIDFSEILAKQMSVSLLLDQLCQIFNSIFEATESEDYSLLLDIIEYDLMPAISTSQEILEVVQGRYEERVK